jgi:signal transduction histidine kinase
MPYVVSDQHAHVAFAQAKPMSYAHDASHANRPRHAARGWGRAQLPLAEGGGEARIATGLASCGYSDVWGFALSTALGELFKPGETIHAVLHAFANMLQASYHAAHCVIALEAGDAPRLYVTDGGDSIDPGHGRPLHQLFAEAAPSLRPDQAVLFSAARAAGHAPACNFYDATTLDACAADPGAIALLARQLQAASFLSVPLRSRSQALGRLHLLWTVRRYRYSDLRTLVQLARQAGPSIESMLLVERLSQAVATQERRRISRDLHDGTIQPYIGLKLGLEALRRKLSEQHAATREVDELIEMAGDGILQLRRYVGRLKSGAQPARDGWLLPSLRQQAAKFTQYCGIRTEIVAPADLQVGARMHDEVLHMVREALSNVRRHTRALRATISLRASAGRLVVEVANDDPYRAEVRCGFHPHSIVERAEDLGGSVRIERRDTGHTAVVIELPL